MAVDPQPGVDLAESSSRRPALSWRRRWLPRFVVLIAVLAILVLFRQAILSWLASWLIVEETPPAKFSLLIAGGDRTAELAVHKYMQGEATEILIVEGAPDRLQRLGIVPPYAESMRQWLI